MDRWRRVEAWTVGLVVLAVVVAGVPGPPQPAGPPVTVGDGTAEVSVDALPTAELSLERGRFGTGVAYLRIPDLRVTVGVVRDAPRIVYRVQVPGLGVDATSTRVLSTAETGRLTVRGQDRGLDPAAVHNASYEARVTVRVQSFEVDETVARATATVPVSPTLEATE